MLGLIVMVVLALITNIVNLVQVIELDKENKDRKVKLQVAICSVSSLTLALITQLSMYFTK